MAVGISRLVTPATKKWQKGYLTVDKGSVTVNGVSLTVYNPTENRPFK